MATGPISSPSTSVQAASDRTRARLPLVPDLGDRERRHLERRLADHEGQHPGERARDALAHRHHEIGARHDVGSDEEVLEHQRDAPRAAEPLEEGVDDAGAAAVG